MSDDRPLPYGWVKEWDPNYQQHFYVDTMAHPPRSIWVHPYEDEQYLRQHPEIPPPVSTPGGESSQRSGPSNLGAANVANVPRRPPALLSRGNRSLLGRLMALGTRRHHHSPHGYHGPPINHVYGPPRGHGRGQHYPQRVYHSQAPPPSRSNRRGLGGGMALPIIGGLAGGLLLGQAIDGFGDGGDGGDDGGFDGGGDFGGDGGDFGGDFGGGGPGGDFGGGGGDFGGGGFGGGGGDFGGGGGGGDFGGGGGGGF